MATFSKEELNYIASQVKPYLLELARADSLEIDDVAVVDDYSGITSMPAYDNGGGLKRIVRVPLSVLAKPAEDAANNLKDAADHPTYIGEDYYVYKWNNDTKVYEKTDIYVRGEAFKVNVVWASEAEMKADTKTYDEGTYGMISTGDVDQKENGVIYVYKSGKWEFFVDMSGKRGADGKTAQFRIGTVTKGDTALASVVENGEDEDGNPIYLINLVLPKGDKGDQGIQGVRGEQGEQGVQGERGLQGEQGEQGEQGKTPIFEIGDIITLEPSEQATAELVFNGTTTDGTPKYKLTISIPRGAKGENGSGSGNVFVETTNLVSSKTYLFKPKQNGSAEGTFVEYEIPDIDTSTLVTDSELTEALKGKQNSISDLESIRSGASKGATAVQPSSLHKVATSGNYNDLSNKPTIPTAVTESTVSGWGFTKNTGTYSIPSTGIPKNDLASDVQTSLGKAETALQSYTEQYKGTITGVSANGTSVATSGVANIPAASTSKYGVVKLSSATNSTSTSLAATPSAVKAAYDLANSYKGTVTGVKINGTTKTPSSGTVDLGTVITDISGKADKITIVNHGTSSTTFTLTPNILHVWGEVRSLTLTLGSVNNSILDEFMFQFTSGETATTLSLPDTIKWVVEPNIEANKIYQCSIINNVGVIAAANNG